MKKIGTTDFLHVIKLACPYQNLVKAAISELNSDYEGGKKDQKYKEVRKTQKNGIS